MFHSDRVLRHSDLGRFSAWGSAGSRKKRGHRVWLQLSQPIATILLVLVCLEVDLKMHSIAVAELTHQFIVLTTYSSDY